MALNSIIIRAAIFLGVAAFFIWEYSSATPSSNRADAAIANHTPGLKRALETKGMTLGAPVFIRIVKTKNGSLRDGYLEIFIERESGKFKLFKSYDICTWSGALGPKLAQGDRQSPEGFYFIKPASLNPRSSYHLSFNLGYPNAFDRAHGRTGDFLMVHGKCVSIGCYAMTDPAIEEIYTLTSAAFVAGQPFIRAHIFPFPMTKANLDAYSVNKNADFWQNLKQGWDAFESQNKPPNVEVHGKIYIFD